MHRTITQRHRGRPHGHRGIHGLRHNPAERSTTSQKLTTRPTTTSAAGIGESGLLGSFGLHRGLPVAAASRRGHV